MMMVFSALVFSAALTVSLVVIGMAVGPQWRRIVKLAMGEIETSFAPLQQLALAERRIAVRRWASAPVPAPFHWLREVA